MNDLIPVLALDMATKTGWALRDRAGRFSSGVQEFSLKRGESKGMRFLRFRKWLNDVLKLSEMGSLENELAISCSRSTCTEISVHASSSRASMS